MKPVERDVTVRDHWAMLRRRWWVVVLAVAAACLGALAFSLAQTPLYEADAQVLVQPRQTGGVFDTTSNNIDATTERAIRTEIQVVEGQTVRDRVQKNLGLETEPPQTNASSVSNTDVIEITVRSTDRETAANLANAYADAYIEIRREQSVNELLAASAEVQNKITELQTQIDGLAVDDPRRGVLLAQQAAFKQTLDQLQVDAALRTGGASVIKPAEVPTDPVEPTPLRTAALAGVVGLLIGLAAAWLIDYADDAVRNEEDLERITSLPVLAIVPVDPPPDNRPVALSSPDDYAVETYRGLRTNLQFLGLDRPLRIIQVTSSIAGEGKTTTATNLAVVLAQASQRVALIDADLRRPRLHEVFATPVSPGLTDLLLGDDPNLVLRPFEFDGGTFDVVASGYVPSNPGELLSGRRIRELIAQISANYDYVIVDSAPILPVADSIALAGAVDGVLVVAQADRTPSKNVAETLERLARVSAPVLGLVLNRAKANGSSGYAYGGYSSYQRPAVRGVDVAERPPVAP